MESSEKLKEQYPWIQTPLVVSAPMRLITLAESAVEVSKAGGIGFIAAGTDVSSLESHLQTAQTLLTNTHLPTKAPQSPSEPPTLPLGIGFINWGASLADAIPLIARYRPAAVWFFAPKDEAQLREWAEKTRDVAPGTQIWVQVGSVAEAESALRCAAPDVLVVQGTDAGGHGLVRGAGVISLVPEVCDAVDVFVGRHGEVKRPAIMAAGGIADARGAAAALVLGADGVVMGTRFLASREVSIARGYQEEVLRARDGGQSTVRTKVYDTLRGTVWAETHNARGVVNRSFHDAVSGMDDAENKRLYEEELLKGDEGWGEGGRLTTYAGSAVGLIKEVKGAGDIVREVRDGAVRVLQGMKSAARSEKL